MHSTEQLRDLERRLRRAAEALAAATNAMALSRKIGPATDRRWQETTQELRDHAQRLEAERLRPAGPAGQSEGAPCKTSPT